MAIEKDLTDISAHLARIATALEALLAERGYVPDSATTVTSPAEDVPAQFATEALLRAATELRAEMSGDTPEAPPAENPPEKKVAKKKATKKKTKKADNKTVVGTPEHKDEDGGFVLTDVRAALKVMQAASSQAAVKSLLKEFGASTLGQLDVSHYGRVISQALESTELTGRSNES